MYILSQEQLLDTQLEPAWDFLQNPHNLNVITPPELHFEIVTDVPEKMYNGLIIEYRITIPLVGRQRWITEIKHIKENHSFVDEQRIGPYRFWYHYHRLTRQEEMVKNHDKVYYLPPYGPLGTLAHHLFIKKALARIFNYRRKKMAEIFNCPEVKAPA